MSQKNKLVKNFKKLINDIMDNYENYSDDEKEEIKKLFECALNLNDKLEKYDKKNIFDILKEAFNNFFGGN